MPVDGNNVTYGYHYSIATTGNTNLEQSLPTVISSEDTQITEYGGFYIARYEAGIPNTLISAINDTSKRDVSGTPVSKKNQVPWNYISWSKSKANAESMYEVKNNNNEVVVQSILLTDRMWETTMQWLQKSGANVTSDSRGWGNYSDSKTPANVSGYGTLQNTGYSEYWKAKNIYDLAGNLWEWTNAKYDSSNYVFRGCSSGGSGTKFPAAFRNYRSESGEISAGFRVALFVI